LEAGPFSFSFCLSSFCPREALSGIESRMAATAHGTTCIFSSEKLNEEVMKIDIHGLSAEQVCPVDWLSCANALRRTAVKVSRVFAPRSTRLLIYLGSNRIFCAPRLWQINLNKSTLKKLAASLRGFTEPCKVITSRLWNMQPFGSAGCCSAFFSSCPSSSS